MGNNIENLRKLLVTGIGTVLMGEEGLVKILSEMKLPRDAKDYLMAQAAKKKEDVSRVIGREVKTFLEHVNIHEELKKSLIGLKINVDATIQVDKAGPKLKTIKSKKLRTTHRKKSLP